METKIIRNDRGLDFRRIEQFLKMFQDKCQRKSRDISSRISIVEKEKKSEAFEHFGIAPEIKAIENIDAQIKELKEQREVHESKVRDFTQGLDKSNRYNSFDSIKEGSPIQQFIDEGCKQLQEKKDRVRKLNELLANELWYARDLEQAIEIMQQFQMKLDAISLDGDANGNS